MIEPVSKDHIHQAIFAYIKAVFAACLKEKKSFFREYHAFIFCFITEQYTQALLQLCYSDHERCLEFMALLLSKASDLKIDITVSCFCKVSNETLLCA